MWRAITDLLAHPHVTPIVRAALLDVAAGLQGSPPLDGGTYVFQSDLHPQTHGTLWVV